MLDLTRPSGRTKTNQQRSQQAPQKKRASETLLSPGRPGSPPLELLTEEIKAGCVILDIALLCHNLPL